MLTEAELDAVTSAARTLDIQPRGERWAHLPLCVLDAVFSIGARYSLVKRTVCCYAELQGLQHPLGAAHDVAEGRFAADERPVSALATFVRESGADHVAAKLGNRQRTSTRHGILKTEAAGRCATILAEHGIETLADVTGLLPDTERLAAVEADLAAVPGSGTNGIRISYLWMLAGDDNTIKPDRMVRRWLHKALDRQVEVAEANAALSAAAGRLGCTPWQLDHAIWTAARARPARRGAVGGH